MSILKIIYVSTIFNMKNKINSVNKLSIMIYHFLQYFNLEIPNSLSHSLQYEDKNNG